MMTTPTPTEHHPARALLAVLVLALSTLACTLSAEAPPTLVPRQTAAPLPTIGYATLSPTELPQQQPVPAAVGTAAAASLAGVMDNVDSDRLMQHVRTLQDFGTRHVNSTQTRSDFGVGAAKNYILTQFQQIQEQSQGALYVFPHEFPVEWAGKRSMQTNVVAVIGGTEPKAGVIIVGAHYDSRGDDIEDAVGYAPGANDNGTGVAALIELGRILSQRPHRATIMLVAFAAEEVGRKGSIAFVDDYVRKNNLDLVAYLNVDAIGSQTYADGRVNDRQMRVFSQGPNDSSRSRQVARMSNLIAFNYVPQMEIVVQDALDRSGRYGDHFSFEEAGYPSVRFIEMAENSAKMDTTDTIDGISVGYFERTTQTILAVVTALADGPQPPRNIALRQNADGTRTLVWEPIPDAVGYVVALLQPDAMIYQQFETTSSEVTWDGFTRDNFVAVAVAAKDKDGLMGPLSAEIAVP